MWLKLYRSRARSPTPNQQDNPAAHHPAPPWHDPRTGGRDDPDATATRIVHLDGDLRSGTAIESVRRQCLGDMTPGRRRVVLDLQHVEHIDTKFIACLVCLRRTADAAGVALELRLSARVRDWLDLCQAGHLFRPSA